MLQVMPDNAVMNHDVPAKKYNIFDQITKIFSNRYILYMVSTILFFLIWDIISIKSLGKLVPRPLEVLNRIISLLYQPLAGKTLMEHLWFSIRRVLIAFGIATIIGIPIGVLMGVNKYIYAIVKPLFDLFKPMPPIAWISLAILWYGIGETSKVFIIILGAVVPVVINSFNGIRLIDPELYDAVRSLGGTHRDEVLQVTLPASFPAIFAGLQISLSVAWSTVLAAELVGAREGMGFIIIKGMNLSDSAMIIGGMVVIALTSLLISAGMSLLERWVCPWKTEAK